MSGDRIESLTIPSVADDCILSECVNVENISEVSEASVEITPCTSNQDSVMAEINLAEGREKDFFDSEIFCFLLNCYDENFSKINCSSELGLGKVDWRDQKIFGYDTGEFKVRHANSREESINMLDSFTDLILGSLICEKCGNPALDCIKGDCCNGEAFETVNVEDYFEPSLRHASSSLFEVLKNSRKYLQDSNWSSKRDELVENLRNSIRYGLDYCVESSELEDARCGLFLVSISRECLDLVHDTDFVIGEFVELSSEMESKLLEILVFSWNLNDILLNFAIEPTKNEVRWREEKSSKLESYLSEVREEVGKELENILTKMGTFIKEKDSLLERYDSKNFNPSGRKP